ncbi:MAG: zinc-finger domain-containing protein [Gammaproteobacteria bacterium]|nr:zinc-finger domain-containing protein [Gammaproteobacteria bacterium]
MSENGPSKTPGIPQPGDADTPNASDRVEITAADLPLHCPMPGKRLWDSHPRVYLPVEDSGEESCPYCGTVFVLKERTKPAQ